MGLGLGLAVLAAAGPAAAAPLTGAAPPASPAASPAAPGPGTGGALRVTADPPRLLLGRDGAAELRVAAPAEVHELSLTATVGRIEGLRRLPSGGFTARYRPPTERFPQVAIVAAAAAGPAGPLDGWLAIPLHGQGDARVQADPGAEVSLVVAGRTFGPVRAGEDGVALVPVVVPPGVREGHQGFRPVELPVPETPLLHAALDRATALADRVERVRVLAYVVAPHGAARRGDEPVFEPTRGSVAVRAREPGAFEAIWTLAPGVAGEERLVVRLPGATASRRVLALHRAPGPASAVAIAFDREVLVAGEADAVLVTARAVDAAGNPVAAELEIAADGGDVEPAAQSTPESRDARVVLGPCFGGRRALVVTARARGPGLSAERVLPLRPGPPAEARLAAAGPLVADGAREARLEVVVLDRFENDTGLAPRVTAALGRVEAVEARPAGGYVVRYVGPAVKARTGERLALEVQGLRAEAMLTLVPPRGPRQGVVTVGPLADVRGRFAGARAGFAFERELALDPGLESAGPPSPALGAWSLSARVEGELSAAGEGLRVRRGAARGARASEQAITVLAGLGAARELRAGPTLFAAATAGFQLARVDPEGDGPDSGTAPAGRLSLGVGWRRRGGMPFLEASLLAVGPARTGAHAALSLSAGWRFDLETRHGDPPHRR